MHHGAGDDGYGGILIDALDLVGKVLCVDFGHGRVGVNMVAA